MLLAAILAKRCVIRWVGSGKGKLRGIGRSRYSVPACGPQPVIRLNANSHLAEGVQSATCTRSQCRSRCSHLRGEGHQDTIWISSLGTPLSSFFVGHHVDISVGGRNFGYRRMQVWAVEKSSALPLALDRIATRVVAEAAAMGQVRLYLTQSDS